MGQKGGLKDSLIKKKRNVPREQENRFGEKREDFYFPYVSNRRIFKFKTRFTSRNILETFLFANKTVLELPFC